MDKILLRLATPSGENRAIYLDDLTKTEILNELREAVGNLTGYRLEIAGDLPEDKTAAKDMITLAEWLAEKGVEVDRSTKHRLANAISRTFMETYGDKPRVITRPDARGKWIIKASGFETKDLWILERSLEEVLKSADR